MTDQGFGFGLLCPGSLAGSVAAAAAPTQPAAAQPAAGRLVSAATNSRVAIDEEVLDARHCRGRLGLRQPNSKTHVAHVYRKLGVRDRAQAVLYVHEAGLVGTQLTTGVSPSSFESN